MDLQNTILAAMLTLSDRLIYPAYATGPLGSLSALDDQSTAGVIMWLPGSLVFLVAAMCLALEALSSGTREHAPYAQPAPARRTALPSRNRV